MGLLNLSVYRVGSSRGLRTPARATLPVATLASDSMESYTDGAAVNGLDGGTNGTSPAITWLAAYADRPRYLGLVAGDDAEGYSDAAALNGLNGGTAYNAFTGWQGAFVNHNN